MLGILIKRVWLHDTNREQKKDGKARRRIQ